MFRCHCRIGDNPHYSCTVADDAPFTRELKHLRWWGYADVEAESSYRCVDAEFHASRSCLAAGLPKSDEELIGDDGDDGEHQRRAVNVVDTANAGGGFRGFRPGRDALACAR